MKLFVGIPCHHAMPAQFAHCLFSMQSMPAEVHLFTGNSCMSIARAILSKNFLDSDCTHLLFIDNDIIFTSEQMQRLMSHDEDIVAGFYPKKEHGAKWVWVCNSLPDKPPADERGLMRVAYMGTGFMKIARSVFERMIEVYGKEIGFKHDDDGRDMWDFFSQGVHRPSNRWLSEDWWFCQRALDMGVPVYGDTKITLKHIGSAVYPLEFNEAWQP